MPIYREVGLVNLALYQQVLRTAERIKTLRREIDDVSREIHKQLDDLDIILEKIPGDAPQAAKRRWIGDAEAPNEAHSKTVFAGRPWELRAGLAAQPWPDIGPVELPSRRPDCQRQRGGQKVQYCIGAFPKAFGRIDQ